MKTLIILDMDGVIFKGRNFWLDLHERLNTTSDAWRLWYEYGESDYFRLSFETANIWRGREASVYFDLIERRSYTWGVKKLLSLISAARAKTAIVSSGPWHLAKRAQDELKIDAIYANKLGIVDGRFTGEVEVQVDNLNKGRAAERARRQFGVPRENTVVIGDTQADIDMGKAADTTVGFRVDAKDEDDFEHVIRNGSISQAYNVIDAYLPPPRSD